MTARAAFMPRAARHFPVLGKVLGNKGTRGGH